MLNLDQRQPRGDWPRAEEPPMLSYLSSAPRMRREVPRWTVVLVVSVLSVPFIIATLALVPALMICPFLPQRRHRLTIQLLVGLRAWSVALAGATRDDTSRLRL